MPLSVRGLGPNMCPLHAARHAALWRRPVANRLVMQCASPISTAAGSQRQQQLPRRVADTERSCATPQQGGAGVVWRSAQAATAVAMVLCSATPAFAAAPSTAAMIATPSMGVLLVIESEAVNAADRVSAYLLLLALLILILMPITTLPWLEWAKVKYTLTQVQVCLAADVKGELSSIVARTSSYSGKHNRLREGAALLLRNSNSCVYAATTQKAFGTSSALTGALDWAAVKERTRLKQQATAITDISTSTSTSRSSSSSSSSSELGPLGLGLCPSRPADVVVAGRSKDNRKGSASSSSSSSTSESGAFVVVTLLVGTDKRVWLPGKVNTLSDLHQVLETLGSLPESNVQQVELLWNPQANGVFYTHNDVLAEYPDLRQM